MKRSAYFFAALALQVAVISWVALPRLWVLHTGRTAMLRTIPVDPRDPFRGDYVVLNYEVSNAPAGLAQAGATVFAVLEEKDGFARATRYTTERPTGGELYLQGKVEERWGSLRVKYGIEAFFVPEGRGLVYERQRNHDARVRISDRGFAVLEALVKRPGVDPDNENPGQAAVPAAQRPASIELKHQAVREADGSARHFLSLTGYQYDHDLVAVLERNDPDDVHDSREIETFYHSPADSVRLLVHLVPVAKYPDRTLTRARLLISVPPGRALDVYPVKRTFGVAGQNWGRQLEAPTWNSARYPKEPWSKPGLLGSPDVGAKLATIEGAADLQGLDITDAAKGAPGTPFGLMFAWRDGDQPHRRETPLPEQLGRLSLEVSWAAKP